MEQNSVPGTSLEQSLGQSNQYSDSDVTCSLTLHSSKAMENHTNTVHVNSEPENKYCAVLNSVDTSCNQNGSSRSNSISISQDYVPNRNDLVEESSSTSITHQVGNNICKSPSDNYVSIMLNESSVVEDISFKSEGNHNGLLSHSRMLALSDKIYKCDICQASLRNLSHITVHYKECHETEAPASVFACIFCGTVFFSSDNVKQHIKSKQCTDLHQPKISCLFCEEMFSSVREIRQHYIENHVSRWIKAHQEKADIIISKVKGCMEKTSRDVSETTESEDNSETTLSESEEDDVEVNNSTD